MTEEKKRIFQTWTHAGVRFIAVVTDRNFHIADEAGNNYGAWLDVERFRLEQSGKTDMAKPLGSVCIMIAPV